MELERTGFVEKQGRERSTSAEVRRKSREGIVNLFSCFWFDLLLCEEHSKTCDKKNKIYD